MISGTMTIVYGILTFIFVLGITIFMYGVLSDNLNDSSTQSFFSGMVDKLTSTVGIIGAVIILGLVSLMFVFLPKIS